MFLFRENLKAATDDACFVSCGKLFHARMVEGKKRITKKIGISSVVLNVVGVSKTVSCSFLHCRGNQDSKIFRGETV